MKSQLLRMKKLQEQSYSYFCGKKNVIKDNEVMSAKDFAKAYRKFKRKMKWKND